MPNHTQKEDLRVLKTYKSLRNALLELLEHRSFSRVTINDLCEEAQISRATFYAHFRDKYDLLEYCLGRLTAHMEIRTGTYAQAEAAINDFVCNHKRVITNLIKDANLETFDLLLSFLLSLLDIPAQPECMCQPDEAHIVLSNFCAGGMLCLLMWQVRNKFPQDLQIFNPTIYHLLMTLLKRESNLQEDVV